MSNLWQQSMYDHMFAESTLNSESLKDKAKQEVEFLVTSLNLPKGSAILDVPCGTGRHSKILAEHGYNVTGLDISTACIDIANKRSKIPGVEYKLGNMQDLSSYSNKFDCTLNLFSSFGYFSNDTENEAVLDEMIKTLRTSGKLVLNLVNRDFLL